jgi:hypothetical protein
MLTADQMPDDNADLAKIPIQLPEVPRSEIADPDSFVPDLLEYLELESFEPDDKLQFVRTADVWGTLYYIWRFKSNGDDCYATISIQNGVPRGTGANWLTRIWNRVFHVGSRGTCRGCGENHWGLTPEQYILADYHNCM